MYKTLFIFTMATLPPSSFSEGKPLLDSTPLGFCLQPCTAPAEFIQDVHELINQLWGLPPSKNYVPCPLPCNLERKDLLELKNNEYFVTPKLDGLRLFLLLGFTSDTNENYSVFIDRAYNIYTVSVKTSTESLYDGTLLDGELDSHGTYHVFDAVCVSGYKLQNKPFAARLNQFNEALTTLRPPPGLRIKTKDFYSLEGVVEVWDTFKHECDGLILQPAHAQLKPGIQKYVFKWKPLLHQTIDFYLSLQQGQVVMECGAGPTIVNANTQGCYWDTTQLSKVSLTTERQVIECKLTQELFAQSGSQYLFTAVKLRGDKVYANDCRTIQSTLLCIHENIVLEEMLQ